jgi:alpha-glucosidase (family GH31 glycosyl hydrolase)
MVYDEIFYIYPVLSTRRATSMVNTENPDYQMCVDNKYLVRDSRGLVRPLQWWHGYGGLLDYSNPEAVSWWHAQMDKVLDAGVDGFKTDGTDPYIAEYELTGTSTTSMFRDCFGAVVNSSRTVGVWESSLQTPLSCCSGVVYRFCSLTVFLVLFC